MKKITAVKGATYANVKAFWYDSFGILKADLQCQRCMHTQAISWKPRGIHKCKLCSSKISMTQTFNRYQKKR